MPTKTRDKSRVDAPTDYKDKSRGRRLQKVLAEAGVASRRHCEELIELGEVRVNGTVVRDLPAWVDAEHDRIVVRGRRVEIARRMIYLMLFKPRGVVATNLDPQGRRRAIDLVDHPSRTRLFPVGRLDLDSSGLLLLTNDGELANRLTHPRYGVHKTYEVTVKGSLSAEDVAGLERGIFLHDRHRNRGSRTRGVRLKLLKRDRDRTRLLMELREGRNRQVRRMMADLGHGVKKLRRVQLGPLKLKGLAPGQWRELTGRELAALRKATKDAQRQPRGPRISSDESRNRTRTISR